MIQIIEDHSPVEFLEAAGPLLYQEESTNGLMLGLCEDMIRTAPQRPPPFIRIIEGGKTVSAAIQTPPMNLIVTHSTTVQIEALARYLQKKEAALPGVIGPAETSESFANTWASLTNQEVRLGMGQKIYELKRVLMPRNVEGRFRIAHEEDREKVFEWLLAFSNESLPPSLQRDDIYWREYANKALRNRAAHFWCVDETPVSIAFMNRATKNGISISCVFTPDEFRKKGYASAVVAHLSQKILDSGKTFCVLYTDTANSTSNKIYQTIGYREVCESKHLEFREL